jgi:RNA polymerase sigma factor (sigma-70 family)
MREPRTADGVHMGSATGAHISPRGGGLQSRRLLRLVGDDRLVEQIRRGSEAAFEVAFERHGRAILSYCRHMLGSPEEAEDAVQHTFAAAYADLQRGVDRQIVLKPWLFAIARNRCLSLLRAGRDHAIEQPELATAGLADQVEQRAELRRLLADLRELPEPQREALLLAEVGDLSQADIAHLLGCEVSRVKGLVYRARSALIARRDARELPCEHVREQLATLRGGSLRRTELRLHLRECPGCRKFREDVRRQRQLLSAALPVPPTLALKSSVVTAVGAGAGGAGAAAAGLVGGGSVVAKLAVAGALAVGGGTAVVVADQDAAPPRAGAGGVSEQAPPPRAEGGAPEAIVTPMAAPASAPRAPRGAPPARLGARSAEKRPAGARGRGSITVPPTETPVRRGPPEGKGNPERAGLRGRAQAPGGRSHGQPRGNHRGPAQGQGRSQGGAKRNGQARGQGHRKPAAPQAEAKPEQLEPAQPKGKPGA